MSSTPHWDVIVIGAGPGGSSTAAVLAEGGARVLVIEKEEFPRFHIGESLLPAAEVVTSLLDVEPDPNVFLFKRGARFVCETTGREEAFDFGEALPGPQRYAWHVDRARFDTLLRDQAVRAGATVQHGRRVDEVELSEACIRVRCGGQVETARYLIDATGQDRLLAKQRGSANAYEHFGKAAVFTHFSELPEAAREEFSPNNDIRIVVVPDGWLWVIPLTGNRMSVGMVSRLPGLRRSQLDDYLAASPLLSRILAGARRDATRMSGSFSFENTEAVGARFACVGDAACFIDPVFSSGVSLAIHRGIATAEQLLPALEGGHEARADLMTPVETRMRRAYDTFAGLVYRFYNTRFVDNVIFGAPRDGQLRGGVISVLAGDVFRDDNPFQDMLLKARRIPARATKSGGRPAEGAPSR